DYTVSDPTTGNPGQAERYAFLWKPGRVSLRGAAKPELSYRAEIEREPYTATFLYDKKPFTLVLLHAVPKKKQPEREIKYLKFIAERYPAHDVLFLGDFNCPETHSVFDPLKKSGFAAALTGVKTTIKMKPAGTEMKASAYDN